LPDYVEFTRAVTCFISPPGARAFDTAEKPAEIASIARVVIASTRSRGGKKTVHYDPRL